MRENKSLDQKGPIDAIAINHISKLLNKVDVSGVLI